MGTVVEMLKGVIVTVNRLDATVGHLCMGQDSILVEQRRMGRDMSELRLDVLTLRQEVVAYHGSVVGPGILISELDERVTRLENERPHSGSA